MDSKTVYSEFKILERRFSELLAHFEDLPSLTHEELERFNHIALDLSGHASCLDDLIQGFYYSEECDG